MEEDDDDDSRSRKSLEEPLGDDDESVSDPENGWEPSDAEAWLDEEREAGAFLEGLEGDGQAGGGEVDHPVPAAAGGDHQERRGPERRRGPPPGVARQIHRPDAMTKRQFEEHRARGHVKYHPGCRHCVRSRALADKHYRFAPLEEEKDDPLEPPVVSAAFCFPA